jgi:hypothetical protein
MEHEGSQVSIYAIDFGQDSFDLKERKNCGEPTGMGANKLFADGQRPDDSLTGYRRGA